MTRLSCLVRLARFAAVVGLSLFAPSGSAAAPSAPAHTALVLLLDRSGSMMKSDPGCVRAEAAGLLISQLKDGDLVNVADFGDYVVPLSAHFATVSASTRQSIVGRLRSCAAADRSTDIAAALAYAVGEAQSLPADQRRAYPVHVVLLTDGRDDPPAGSPSGSPSARDALRQLHQLGAVVHGLGLGAAADRQLLGEFSALTGGHVTYATEPRDLVAGFLELTRLIGRRWLVEDIQSDGPMRTRIPVPAWATGWQAAFIPTGPQSGSISFQGAPPSLIRPSFVLAAGNRQGDFLEVASLGPGRVVVDVTGDLALSTQVPRRVAPGVFFKCEARLVSPANLPLGRPRFIDGATVTLSGPGLRSTTLHDDGQHADGASSDGVFAANCLSDGSATDVKWVAVLSAMSPVLDSPSNSGTMRVVGSPVRLLLDGPFTNGLRAALGIRASVALLNETDTPLSGELNVGNRVARVNILAAAVTTVSLDVPYQTFGLSSYPVSFDAQPGGQRFELGAMAMLPRALFPATGLFLVGLIASSAFFPRRSAVGSTLSVRGQSTQPGEDGFSGVGRIDATGKAVFRDPVPEPFAEPGTVKALSGVWRRGVHYHPADWMSPDFGGRVPGTSKSGYRISSVASWTCSRGPYKVTYTLTPTSR